MAVVQHYVLASVSRATAYAQKKLKPVDELDLLHSRLLDEWAHSQVPQELGVTPTKLLQQAYRNATASVTV